VKIPNQPEFIVTIRKFIAVLQRKGTVDRDERMKFVMEWLLIFIAVGSLGVPLPYSVVFLIEDADAYRRLLKQLFGLIVRLKV